MKIGMQTDNVGPGHQFVQRNIVFGSVGVRQAIVGTGFSLKHGGLSERIVFQYTTTQVAGYGCNFFAHIAQAHNAQGFIFQVEGIFLRQMFQGTTYIHSH